MTDENSICCKYKMQEMRTNQTKALPAATFPATLAAAPDPCVTDILCWLLIKASGKKGGVTKLRYAI